MISIPAAVDRCDDAVIPDLNCPLGDDVDDGAAVLHSLEELEAPARAIVESSMAIDETRGDS